MTTPGWKRRATEAIALWLGETKRFMVSVLPPGGVTPVAYGRASSSSAPRVLLGLAKGTCHLQAALPGINTGVQVGPIHQNDIGWHTATPDLCLPIGDDLEGVQKRDLRLVHGSWSVILTDCVIDSVEYELEAGQLTGWTTGHAFGISINPEAVGLQWTTAVSGPGLSVAPLSLPGHQVTFHRRARWRLATVELSCDQPATALQAEQLVRDLLRVAQLAGEEPGIALATWLETADGGVASVGEVLRPIDWAPVPENDAQAFMQCAGDRLTRLSADELTVLRLLIDMYALAGGPHLEPSVALATAALELASEQWLEDEADDVPKVARTAIRKALSEAAAAHAPESNFAGNVDQIGQFLFKQTAKKRFHALLSNFAIEPDDESVAQLVNVRNKIVHGGFETLSLQERFRALCTARWMLGTTIVRFLGYEGPLHDPRDSHLS